MIALTPALKPASALGGFFAMALDTLVALPRRPFAWREFVGQAWFVARVSLVPTVMLAVPYSVLVVFTFNILLLEFGAADFSGTTAAFATVTQIGPIVTVLVVPGDICPSLQATNADFVQPLVTETNVAFFGTASRAKTSRASSS